MGDTGLLVSLTFSDDELAKSDFYKNVLQGKLSINKGMFFENAIAQSLVSKGKQLYFYTHYSNEKKRNDIEIDFLVSNGSKTNGLLNPIEVKSSKNYTTTSYLKFKKKFQSRIGESYIVHPKGFSKDENGYRIPGYMFFCI
jgi:predicted AAA+ superfamily ATPase